MRAIVRTSIFVIILGAVATLLCGCGTKEDDFKIHDEWKPYNTELLSEGKMWDAIISAQVEGEDCSFLAVENNEKMIVSHFLTENVEITGGEFQVIAGSDGETLFVLETGQDNGFRLVHMTWDGQVICASDVAGSKTFAIREGITDMDADMEGNVYIAWNKGQTGHLEIFSPSLEVLWSLETSGVISAVATVNDTTYCLVAGTRLVPVDLETGRFGTELKLILFLVKKF